MIDRPMNRRNQNAKRSTVNSNSNSVKARKWEKLVGWSVEPDQDSYYIGIEAWSKRKYKECTSEFSVEYLCSNDHFCDGIVDWDSFISASLKNEEICTIDTAFEKTDYQNELETDEVYEKKVTTLDKLTIVTVDSDKDTGNGIVRTINVEQAGKAKKNNESPSCKANKDLTNADGSSCKPRYINVRPISSNSLPEKKAKRTPPRRHALSANDTYIDFPVAIPAPSDKVKFSYTKKNESQGVENDAPEKSSNDNEVTEMSNRDNPVSRYNIDHLQLHKRYVLPNSSRVSIGDLLHSHPRIERHYARDRDIVFSALANDMDSDLPKTPTQQSSSDNHTDSNHNSVGLPPVTQKPKTSNDNSKHVNEFKNVASMPRIPLLSSKTSKSADEMLLKEMGMNGLDQKEETTHHRNVTSLHGYITHSRCNDIDANYTPKTAPTHLQEYYTSVVSVNKKVKSRQPRGPPAFRAATSKTPLHRAIESAHKKLHGPHHRLLSKSSSRLTDNVVEAPVEKRRWSSSLPKSKQHVGLTPEVNNTVTWRKELESHIRYQRSTSNARVSARVNAPLTNAMISSNNTTIAINKLSRRKKSQLRIGDTLYNVGTCTAQSAGSSHTRIGVER